LDDYRVDREWARYEGNALRDLFRELRERFLARHRSRTPGPVLEVGPGPGRFSPLLGGPEHPRVLLDLSEKALRSARDRLTPGDARVLGESEFVRGDALAMPFRGRAFGQIALLGNTLGFAGPRADELLSNVSAHLRPEGTLLIEVVAGPGERSRYLHRLPPGAVRRLLSAPPRAVLPRIRREGFVPVARPERPDHEFRRYSPEQIERRLGELGLVTDEALAVAPALGAELERPAEVRKDPRAWARLLEVEEALGHDGDRQRNSSALLVAARRDGA
jgi:SAM-dependent methyltransferase